jgi:hypothetical protein
MMTDERHDEPPAPEPEAQLPAVRQPKAELVAGDRRDMMFMPRTIEEAQRYASGLIAANQIPDAFRYAGKDVTRLYQQGQEVREGEPNAPLILMGILKVMELEVPPQTGLAGLLPLNGRFNVWGDLAAALVQRSGKVKDHTEGRIGPGFDPDLPLGEWPQDYGWEVRYWRVGQEQPYVGRFTVRDAKRPNLWMNAARKPWLQYPDRMLFNRARAFALRDGFADALMGLSIAEEVIDSLPPASEDGGELTTRHRDAFDDEPETEDAPALEHQPSGDVDPAQAEPEKQPEDLLKRNF